MGFLEKWGVLVPQDPPVQQEAQASCLTAPKASSIPYSHLRTKTVSATWRGARLVGSGDLLPVGDWTSWKETWEGEILSMWNCQLGSKAQPWRGLDTPFPHSACWPDLGFLPGKPPLSHYSYKSLSVGHSVSMDQGPTAVSNMDQVGLSDSQYHRMVQGWLRANKTHGGPRGQGTRRV